MGRVLRTAVHLTDPDTHDPVVLLPGEEPPERLAALILHPAAWEGAEVEIEPADSAAVVKKPRATRKS